MRLIQQSPHFFLMLSCHLEEAIFQELLKILPASNAVAEQYYCLQGSNCLKSCGQLLAESWTKISSKQLHPTDKIFHLTPIVQYHT
jgi:hypothetical protein